MTNNTTDRNGYCDTVDYYRDTFSTPRKLYLQSDSKLEPPSSRRDETVMNGDVLKPLMLGKYRTSISGLSLMKDVVSLHLFSALLERLRPRTVFDLGTADGGSALWFARQCKVQGLDDMRIVTVDIHDFRRQPAKDAHASCGNVTAVQADLTKSGTFRDALAAAGVDLPHPWLIAEDCHVELTQVVEIFNELGFARGDYLFVEDTNPAYYKFFQDDLTKTEMDFEFDVGEHATPDIKQQWVKQMLDKQGGDEAFAIDATIQDMFGYNGSSSMNSVFVKL